jgi:multidrug efflux pump subunit AcrB
MSWGMIFGLGLATILTLVIIPIIYYTVFRRRYERRPA